MFIKKPLLLRCALAAVLCSTQSIHAFAEVNSEDSPWDRRMEDVTDLFGVRIDGKAVNATGAGYNPKGFDTFTPFQQNQQNIVGAYGATEVGVGCNGLNLGTVLDGQIGQYTEMIEQFISDAPSLAIMYLAYSQPTVKSVIDQLNMVGQFGLDMSNLTCSGVRQLADKAYEEKKQTVAEADCTVDKGFKSTECMAGEGLTGSLIKGAEEMKAKASARAGTLMGAVSGATGGLISVKGGSGNGSGGAGNAGPGSSSPTPSRNCSGTSSEGTTALLLAASELGCDDIKEYSGLLPSYSTEGSAPTVVPRQETLEAVSKRMTEDYVTIYNGVYASDGATYQESEPFKKLVNRAGIVITENEFKFMRELSRANPAMFANTQRNLATLAMMKEMEQLVGQLELGILTGLSNQVDNELISTDMVTRYHLSAQALRKEYEILKNKINADIERNELLQATYRSVR